MDFLPFALGVIVLCIAYVATYRLFFHPLSAVPGPKLAALTSLHEFYYDCLKGNGGLHAFKMREMHEQYGSCIRINPWEVHIDGRADPDFWDVLYSHSNRLDKDGSYYDAFGAGLSAVSTGPADVHRARRAAMSNYFSMTNIRSYEPMVLNRVSKLCNRMKDGKKRSEPMNFTNAYRCLSVDVVSSFALPEPRKLLDSPDLGKAFARVIRNFSRLITYQRHLKIVFPLLTSIPDWVMLRIESDGAGRELVETQLGYEKAAKVAVGRQGIPPTGQPPSILDALVSSSEIGLLDKLHGRIVEEARNTVGAGTETTAATLTVLTYHVLANSGILNKLKAELQDAGSDRSVQLNMKTLEKLSYLQACINEALRMCVPVTGRLPRSNPRAATTYTTPTGKTYTFPPGSVMSMSMPDLHFNPDIFPEPHSFKPERWLESSLEVKAKMQRFFVPFGKGSRSCIGMDLAKMELILTAGNIFRDFDLQLFETTDRDVSWAHDFFAPAIPFDSQGLQVMMV